MKPNTWTRSKKVTVTCLVCKDEIYVGQQPKIGSYVICNGCHAEFQISDLEPLLIDWPVFDGYSDEEEGYYDDVYDEDDY